MTRLGQSDDEHTQHLGIGRALIALAEKEAKKSDFNRIAVISAIGTREYYRKLGFTLGKLYMEKELS